MTSKEKIMEIIETVPEVKKVYEDKEGCFRNLVVPALTDDINESDVFELMLVMLASQCRSYDILLNNIAVLGSKELIEKCRDDIRDSVYAE